MSSRPSPPLFFGRATIMIIERTAAERVGVEWYCFFRSPLLAAARNCSEASSEPGLLATKAARLCSKRRIAELLNYSTRSMARRDPLTCVRRSQCSTRRKRDPFQAARKDCSLA